MSTFVKVSKKTVSEAPLKEAIILDRLVGTIINNINPAKNQLDKHRELQESEPNNWCLTTKEIEEIVGKNIEKRKVKTIALSVVGSLLLGKNQAIQIYSRLRN